MTVFKNCIVCGREFIGRPRSKSCSIKCAAVRKKLKDKERSVRECDKLRRQAHEWKKQNPEKCRESARRRRKKYPEKFKEYQARDYEKHGDKRRHAARIWHWKHQDQKNETSRRYHEKAKVALHLLNLIEAGDHESLVKLANQQGATQ